MTVSTFIESLRRGRYTSIGSYPKFWATADGGVLSYEACMQNVWQIARAIRDRDSAEWRVVNCDVNWEDSNLICDHTGDRIASAYAG